MALRGRNGDRKQRPNRVERRARACHETVFYAEHYFALYQQVVIEHERILCEVDGALDGVFDRYETKVNFARVNRIKHVRHRPERNVLQLCQVALGEECLFGERSCWAEIADATCFRHLSKTTSQR